MNEPTALVEHFFRQEFGRLVAVLTRSLAAPGSISRRTSFKPLSCRPWKPGLSTACRKTRPAAKESLPLARVRDGPNEATAVE